MSNSKELDYALKIGFLNAFRYGSPAFFDVVLEARASAHKLDLSIEDLDLVYSDVGTWAEYEGQRVPLDLPIATEDWDGNALAYIITEDDGIDIFYLEAEKDPPLNKPMRSSGPSKFKVFVRNPKTGNVKKINFGLSVTKEAIQDDKRRASFIARHRCETNKDKLSAAYWACRAPRLFGLSFRYW